MSPDNQSSQLSLRDLIEELFKALFSELVIMTIGMFVKNINTKYIVVFIGTIVTGIVTFAPKLNLPQSTNSSSRTGSTLSVWFNGFMSAMGKRSIIINLIAFADIGLATYIGVLTYGWWQKVSGWETSSMGASPILLYSLVLFPLLLILIISIGMWHGKRWARAANAGLIFFIAIFGWMDFSEHQSFGSLLTGLISSLLVIYLYFSEDFEKRK